MSIIGPSAIVFPSIPAFREHFKEYPFLNLDANQELVVRDITSLTDEDPTEQADEPVNLFSNDLYKKTLHLFNRIFYPYGKTFQFILSLPTDCTLHSPPGKDLTICFTTPTRCQLKSGKIETRVTDLFRQMLAASVKSIVFAPGQRLVAVGLKAGEEVLELSIEKNCNFFFKRLPAGFAGSFEFFGGSCSITAPLQSFGNEVQQHQTLVIESAEGFEFSLIPKYFLGYFDFWKALQNHKGVMSVPPNQTLTLQCSDFNCWEQECLAFFSDRQQLLPYLLGQLALPLGKSVALDSENVSYRLQANTLKLTHPEGFKLSLNDKPVIANFIRLQIYLLRDRLNSFNLAANQEIWFPIHDDEEAKELGALIREQNFSKALSLIFYRNGLGGYKWDFNLSRYFNIKIVTTLSQKHFLSLKASSPTSFKLKPISAKFFITQILCASSPELMDGLLAGDWHAYPFLIFRALLHYCSSSFHDFQNEPPPPFFKKSTQEALVALKRDQKFIKAMQTCKSTPELDQRCYALTKLSPREFDSQNKEQLPPPIKYVFQEVLKLVYQELLGSPFITPHLQTVMEDMNDKNSLVYAILAYKRGKERKV